jgi:hypothetical protein
MWGSIFSFTGGVNGMDYATLLASVMEISENQCFNGVF